MISLAAAAACESPPVERPPLAITSASPSDGERGVATTILPTVTFNVPLDPNVVGSGLIGLHSGDLRPGGRVRYSMADRTATFIPAVALRARLAYVVTLDPNVRGIHGGALPEPFEATFVTGDGGPDRPADPPTPDYAADVAPLVDSRCASCHSGPSPAAGLPLDGASGLPGTVERTSSQWLGWRVVDPGAPERSYLMYKIVAAPGVMGEAMPPRAPLGTEERRTLERWIAGGAHVAGE